MNVLLVGSGGREHAIAWKLAQSPRLTKLWIAPGNPGTALLGENLPVSADDLPGLVAAARARKIDLAVIGPEAPLARGLADALQAAGIRVFGPTRSAAQIEGSKAFAKAFMARHGIPTARYAVFTQTEAARQYLEQVEYPVVIKASGLAAGKGVILPDSIAEGQAALDDMLVKDLFGDAGQTVVIEERLQGEELSLLAFSDGFTFCVMPPAQDHKRLRDGDQGPNTGGMGAYAPAPAGSKEIVDRAVRTILQPAVDGLRAEGMPFVGVLYAGLILTEQGPKALEFNCRFGDPETQCILPLLETDLLSILDACARGELARQEIRWKAGACACVVAATAPYPASGASGIPIFGLVQPATDGIVFQAGTRQDGEQVVTAGGRVLGLTGWGADLPAGLKAAYALAERVHFDGMQYRRDIGHHALQRISGEKTGNAYAQAGVSIAAGNAAVQLMSAAVKSTYTPAVLAGIGSFGGLFDAAALQTMRRPVLVASTDGVGTKIMLAAQAGRYASIGQDIVNHCINDILVQGARPLFFLDYFATSRLSPEITAEIVGGIAAACREAGCALIGGETAEMPGVYAVGEFDLAGTIVGVVEFDHILPRKDLQAGDLLVGLPSSGPHTNGYSLIRRIFQDVPLDETLPELGCHLADALLAPHRSYLPWLAPILAMDVCPVKALAHITGGGMLENIPRILPDSLGAVVRLDRWDWPPLFRLIQKRGSVDRSEMARVFNLGIGMVAVVSPDQLEAFSAALTHPMVVIGELVQGEKKVTLV